MLSFQIVFTAVAAITICSGLDAFALVAFSGARNVASRRAVALRLAKVAVIGVTTLSAMLPAR